MKLETDTLYAVLNQKRATKGYSWRELARELDVDQSVFSRMASGKNPDAESLAKMLYWSGSPVSAFLMVEDRDNPEEVDLLTALTTEIHRHKGLDESKKKAIIGIIEAALHHLHPA